MNNDTTERSAEINLKQAADIEAVDRPEQNATYAPALTDRPQVDAESDDGTEEASAVIDEVPVDERTALKSDDGGVEVGDDDGADAASDPDGEVQPEEKSEPAQDVGVGTPDDRPAEPRVVREIKAFTPRACKNCGTKLRANQRFCPQCGTKCDDVPESSAPLKNRRNILLIAAIAVVALILIIVLATGGKKKGPDFKAIYKNSCDSKWASVGEDGSYLSIDTNPYDIDDYSDYEAYLALKDINKQLGLPDYLIEAMDHTNSLMGMQSEAFDSLGIRVSWSYHPDNGLKVTYSKQ